MTKIKAKSIGILGGAGPAATAQLHQLLIGEAQRLGAVQDSDYPPLIIHSFGWEGFDERGGAASMRAELRCRIADALHELRRAGAELLLMPCNTYEALLDGQAPRELIGLAEQSARACAAYEEVLVLCSRTSRELGLHARTLTACGTRVRYPADQAQVDQAILALMGGREQQALRLLKGPLSEAPAETAVLLGCTELSLIYEQLQTFSLAAVICPLRLAARHAAAQTLKGNPS